MAYAVARTFRAEPALRDVHLVALTGYGRDEDQVRAIEAGFERFMRKPADIVTLRRALAKLLQPA